ncbi:MAG: YwaF family protein [Oscillospiraceae bacterium]|nr:YwaF family protein [Oscillospiraceae bacterium]
MHAMFGGKHLLILGISIALMVLLALFVRKWPLEKLAKRLLAVGVVSEFIKVFYYTIANEATHGGILPKTDLPFHLCSIQILFIFLVVYATNPKLKELLLSFMIPSCLFGGIAALLIPTDSSLNGGWILTVQYFGYHIAIVVFALTLLLGKQMQLTVKHYGNCIKFLLGLMLFAVYINSILYDGVSNINFMYVASPPKSGLPFLTEEYGWLVYVAHYLSLILFFVTLTYSKPLLAALRKKTKV